jgi:hypothetical protein
MVLYFEKISIINFMIGVYKFNIFKHIFQNKVKKIYYIDCSSTSKKFLIPALNLLIETVERLNFKMMYIKGEDGELVETRIGRSDMFDFQKEIISSDAYKDLRNLSWEQYGILDYINKALIDGYTFEDSPRKKIFTINVINWHMKKINVRQSIAFISLQPWLELYVDYSKKYGIKLIDIPSDVFSINFRRILRGFPGLYQGLKNIKNEKLKKEDFNDKTKVFIEGRGDLELINNGMHSDFFCILNSEFSLKNVLIDYESVKEKKYFNEHGISSIDSNYIFYKNSDNNYKVPFVKYSSKYKDEYKEIKSILNSYNLYRQNWSSKFKQNNVRVFFSWYKFNSRHIAIADSISDNNGISAVWQIGFDGFENVQMMIKSDIAFCFSSFSSSIDKKVNSKIKYNIIVGYVKDYAAPLVIEQANELRNQLMSNGAKKIIFAIDENSNFDDRWHTGNGLQRENYSYILKKIIEVPWLGVIFKPKNIKTLMERLGPEIEKLLYQAEATGRCYIYRELGRHTTSAPPVLAALSADVCIHGHLNAGTAALESVLAGVPTLLIDREGAPYSKLYDLPKGKVVFQDWPSAIDALMDYFNTPSGIDGFGDWSSIIDELDPFRDGLAAYRMGTYLKWLVDGFDNGLEREEVMSQAASKYKKLWGDDKVIIS